MMHRWKFGRALPVAVSLFAAEAIAETTLDWRFDTSDRASKIVAPDTRPAVLSAGFETAFWDRVETDAISVSTRPYGFSIFIR